MFSKILLATDGSNNALRAARHVAQMVKNQPAEVTILSAAYVPSTYLDDFSAGLLESFLKDARQALDFTRKVFDQEQVSYQIKLDRDRHPAEAILHEAGEGDYDLIVLGSRGLSNREAKRLGSISQEVAERARCSVLLIR